MNLRFPYNSGNLTCCGTISFSRITLFHRVSYLVCTLVFINQWVATVSIHRLRYVTTLTFPKITLRRWQTNKTRLWNIGGMTLAGETPCRSVQVASGLGCFTSGEDAPGIPCIGSLTGHAGLTTRANIRSLPLLGMKSGSFSQGTGFHLLTDHNTQGKNHVWQQRNSN
jgi:hypothetical protein